MFADPPYKDAPRELPTLLRFFAEHAAALLGPSGLVVAEHDRRDAISAPPPLQLVDARRYGDTALSLFAPSPADLPSPDQTTGDLL